MEQTKAKKTSRTKEMVYVGGAGIVLFSLIYLFAISGEPSETELAVHGKVLLGFAEYYAYIFIVGAGGHSARHWGAKEGSGSILTGRSNTAASHSER